MVDFALCYTRLLVHRYRYFFIRDPNIIVYKNGGLQGQVSVESDFVLY